MIRTQIQLTDRQSRDIRRLAVARGVSLAELIRQGVDMVLDAPSAESSRARMTAAMRAFGVFHSGTQDLATTHDESFAEAIVPRTRAHPVSRRRLGRPAGTRP